MALISLGNLVDNVNGFFIKHGKGECHPIEVDTNLIDNDFLDSLSVVHFVIFLGDFELNSIKTVGAIYDNYVLESLNRP
jgi:hypothetical protein